MSADSTDLLFGSTSKIPLSLSGHHEVVAQTKKQTPSLGGVFFPGKHLFVSEQFSQSGRRKVDHLFVLV